MDERRRKPILDFLLSLLTLGFYDCFLMYAIPSDLEELEKRKSVEDRTETLKSTQKRKLFVFPVIFALLSILTCVFLLSDLIYGNARLIIIIPTVSAVISGICFSIWQTVYVRKLAGTGLSVVLGLLAFAGLRIIGLCVLERKLSARFDTELFTDDSTEL